MAWLALGTTMHELSEGVALVGSGSAAQWRVRTADLAPEHFVVTVRGADMFVRAAWPETVVVVNGAQVRDTPQALRDGDVILAGNGRFFFATDKPAMAPADSPAAIGYLVDDQAGVAHPMIGRSTAIGRDASNAIIVRDPTASRFHAEVRREAGGFVLRSIGASGTVLNWQPLTSPSLLAEGDEFELAFAILRFTTAPAADLVFAEPHSMTNDAAARRPTLTADAGLMVEEANESRRASRLNLVVAGLIFLAALRVTWWWVQSW